MNDIRRTVLWVIFAFSMILLWDKWQLHNGNPTTFLPSPQKPVATQHATGAAPSPANTAVPAGNAGVPSAVPGTSGATAAVVPPVAAASDRPVGQRVVVRTDVLELTFNSEGGSLIRVEMLKLKDTVDRSKQFVLLDETGSHVYVAQSGLIGTVAGVNYPTHKTPMTVTGAHDLQPGENEMVITFTSPDVGGATLTKTYTIRRGAYDMAVRHAVTNTGSTELSAQLYLQLVRDGNKPAGESSFYSTFTGPAVYTEAKKYQKVDFANIKKGKAEYEHSATNGYIAMVQHYFASAWILPDGVKRSISMDAVDVGSPVPDCCYRATMIAPIDPIAPGATKAIDAKFFAGPQVEKQLETLAPGLELVKDYGWLTILAKPLYWLLDKIHSFLGNWGWSIMGLVLLLKIAFYWLNAKAYSSMAKMKAINPRITEMRERLKESPQQMQQEMMKIYREEKVNPMGGCFPIMVQIPVFIALYWVLLSSVEMRNAPWAMWIHDLSAPDPYFILPIFMTLTTLLQTALNPAPPDPMQAKLMWFMPLIFSVMFFFFPSGLVLYWITNNVLSIAQQWVINTRMGVPPQFNLPKF
ncbi:MAG: membrane protein insertase YidC [Rhodoferax sp.]|nr:membrane protein insertase YidC [Rhodoferax sp.]MBP9929707.1 membrane protein insertase YidC [Rhodoferax sp.]HQX58451.1 membrane protein insertase YidC [Burkholderiaceae bacterium]HQZ07489.1 membrane protein insertase YidC [Burkholderiaceae bacterium]HRA61388.1 membrane protein insertase YidC [Burkholderiaceae bacterium]